MPKGGKGPKNPRRKPSAAAIARSSKVGSKAHRQATRAVTARGGLKKRGIDISKPTGKGGKKDMPTPVSGAGMHGQKSKPGEGQVAYAGMLYTRANIGAMRAEMNKRGVSMLEYMKKRPGAAARLGLTAKDLQAIKTSNVQTTAARKTVAAAAKKANKNKKSGKKGNKPRNNVGQVGGGAA